MSAMGALGLGTRSAEPERMDAEGLAADVMADALVKVGSFTRVFGGVRAVRKQLKRFPGASLLDVGAGDLSLIASLATDMNGAISVGVDSHADVVTVGGRTASRHKGLQVVRADGRSLPFADRSFDLVISTLTLHHLDDTGAAQLMAEMARVARRGILVWDLERSVVALGGALALARTVWRRDPLVRYDAPLSVRRAFTASELALRASAAGLVGARVRRVWPARLELTAGSTGGPP